MVAEFLIEGAENAQTGRELRGLLHLTARNLTAAVERERRGGAPICARTGGARPGYYLARSRQEMQIYCQSLHRRAAEIHKTRRACLAIAETLPDEPEKEGKDIDSV